MEFINNLLGEVGEALSYDTCCLNWKVVESKLDKLHADISKIVAQF